MERVGPTTATGEQARCASVGTLIHQRPAAKPRASSKTGEEDRPGGRREDSDSGRPKPANASPLLRIDNLSSERALRILAVVLLQGIALGDDRGDCG